MAELLEHFDWSAIIPFVQDTWSSIVETFTQLFQGFINFMRQIIAFWNENEDVIENTVRNVKTFVRKMEDILSRIYYVDRDRQVWVTETPQELAIDVEDVPERLRQTLSVDGRIGLLSAEDEDLIRERFA